MAKKTVRIQKAEKAIGSREAVETAIDATKSGHEATWEESAARSFAVPSWNQTPDRTKNKASW